MKRITNIQVKDFLEDFQECSETSILEEGKEKEELIAIAKAKGINLKKNKDLAGFKTIYTFANKANKNKARLPKEKLLKALPTLIGKPVDVDHQRRFVVGHYIDYRYKQKEDMVIAYGVFYKTNFGDEWDEAKKLFKKKKLATSYEIWCPEDKRKILDDGTYELLEMEIAGGALLYKEEPAFSGAKVLEIAKRNLEQQPADLVFAKKYKEEEIIQADYFKKSVEDNARKLEEEKKANEQIKVKCSNCNEEFTPDEQKTHLKCPKCFAIVDKEGTLIYPPQIKDFKIMCPSCHTNKWLILSRKEDEATLKCGQCSKEYKVKFDKIKSSENLDKLQFVYTGQVSCYQCGKVIYYSGTSAIKKRTLECPRCKLTFTYDIGRERYKKVSEIVEIEKEDTEKSSEKGGKETMEFTLEITKYHRSVDDYDKMVATLPNDYGESQEVAKRLTTEQRNALPDNRFAVVVRVKDKRTGKMRKVRKYPINDKSHVRNALARLGQPKAKETLRKLGVSIETVKRRILKRARQLKMTELLERYKTSSKKNMKKEIKKKEVKVEKSEKVVKKEEQPKAKEILEKKVESKAKEAPKAEEKQGNELVYEMKDEKIEKAKIDNDPGLNMLSTLVSVDGHLVTKVEAKKLEEAKKEKNKYSKSKTLRKAVNKIRTAKKDLDSKKERVELLTAGIKKATSQVISLKKEIKKIKEEEATKIDFYKANAKKVIKRREELGTFADKLTDEELLVNDKFERAKLEKENNLLKSSLNKGKEIVGIKPKDEGYYKETQKEIDNIAFGRDKKDK